MIYVYANGSTNVDQHHILAYEGTIELILTIVTNMNARFSGVHDTYAVAHCSCNSTYPLAPCHFTHAWRLIVFDTTCPVGVVKPSDSGA